MALSPVVGGFIGSYSATTVIAILLVGYAYAYHRDSQIGWVFMGLTGAVGLWSAAALGRAVITGTDARLVLTIVEHIGITSIPVWLFLFAILYADGHWLLNRRRIAVLFVFPVLAVVGVGVTGSYPLFYRSIHTWAVGGLSLVVTTPGPGAQAFAVFGYGLLVLSAITLVYALGALPAYYRARSFVVVVGITIPFTVEVVRLLGEWPYPAIDPRPPALILGSCLLGLGTFSGRLVDAYPTGRALAFDSLADALIILDGNLTVVGANDVATELLPDPITVGRTVDDVLPPALSIRHWDATEGSRVRTLETEGEERYYRQELLPLRDDNGWVLVLADVTDERRIRQQFRERRRFLKRQNERLEEFASVVSHDLRNPLNVASGNLDLAREQGELDRLADADAALDRMEVLIEDILSLARQGQTVGTTEEVALSDVAEVAWAGVPTGDATLRLDEDLGTVQGDPDRLEALFENLFRNSVEHGGDNPTVGVGPTDDGFFVEDDGPGIPDDERQAVFDHGYSTSVEGTGFGLSIVRSIVEAHDWRIEATEAPGGGARFEIDVTRRSHDVDEAL